MAYLQRAEKQLFKDMPIVTIGRMSLVERQGKLALQILQPSHILFPSAADKTPVGIEHFAQVQVQHSEALLGIETKEVDHLGFASITVEAYQVGARRDSHYCCIL